MLSEARRDALRSLQQYSAADWESVGDDLTHSVVTSLSGRLLEKGRPFAQREVATVLGNIGARSKDAIPTTLVNPAPISLPGPITLLMNCR